MKHYPCEKCGTRHRPTRHHILPKVFFGGYGGISDLCCGCHREIERRILQREREVAGNNKITRHKLNEKEYRQILADFLNEKSQLAYIHCVPCVVSC